MDERRRVTRTVGDSDDGVAIGNSTASTNGREQEEDSAERSHHVTRPGLSLALIFAVSAASLSLVLYNCPELDE